MQAQSLLHPGGIVDAFDCNNDHARSGGGGGVAFALFVLLTAILFLRPTETIDGLASLPLYEIVFLLCAVCAAPALCANLGPTILASRPTTLFVLAMGAAVAASHLSHGNTYGAFVGAVELSKSVFYFLLLVSVVNSAHRLGTFLRSIAISILFIASLAVLRYHGFAGDSGGPLVLNQLSGFDEYGEPIVFRRLQATGIFGDPNDFSLALVTALIVCAHFALEQGSRAWRVFWFLPIAVLAHAFAMTQSRGGLLAAGVGIVTYSAVRWNWKRWVPVAALMLPVVLLALGGRQTNLNFDDPTDTAQGRLALWSDAITLMKTAPLFGVGHAQLAEELGLVAHNSYVQCFAELGLFGGTLFVGLFFVPLASMWRIGNVSGDGRVAPDLPAWRPCVMAVLVSYMAGLCSLTRSYAVMTYLVIGVAATFCNLVSANVPSVAPKCSLRLFACLGAISVGVLVAFSAFTRVLLR